MRLAWISPLPPIRSGIADYSAELLPALSDALQIELFAPPPWDAAVLPPCPIHPLEQLESLAPRFDLLLYHLGNNRYHRDIYELALRRPGLVVLHDYVLHHLVARCTVHGGDLAGYLWHLAYERGAAGVALGLRRHYRLFSEPEYFGTALNRLLLAQCRGVIVHNDWMAGRIRRQFPDLPLARVPHHLAPLSLPDRDGARRRLGLAPDEIVLATFGFLARYKRIDRLLAAYARLVPEYPRLRCFLVGKPAPGLALPALLDEYGLTGRVDVSGYVDLETFYSYMAACDVAVNLRYPSAGETSGALVRLLGAGKPVLVSNFQQFAEWPDSVCLKVDLGPAELPMLLHYLRRLIEDEALRRQLGENARRYVGAHHALERSAQAYLSFIWNLARQERSNVLTF